MSEPTTEADVWFEIVPGILHWTIHDERIDFRSDAFAVADGDGWVVIDPLPLAREAMAALGGVRSVVLTAPSHQRAAWTFRAATGAPVSVPRGSPALDEKPDRHYAPGDALPGRLRAIAAPGPNGPHHALVRDLDGGGRILFTGDLLLRPPAGPPRLLPDEYLADLALARRTTVRLASLAPTALGLAHGAPVLEDAAALLLRAAEAD